MNAAYRCPRCGSDDTASLRSVYEHGTGVSSGSVVGVGGGHLFVGGTSGRTMTRAAMRAAPPERMVSGWFVLGLIVAVVALVVFVLLSFDRTHGSDTAKAGVFYVAIAIEFVLFILSWSGRSELDEQYRQDVRQWSNGWMCQRCGWRFAA